MSRQTTTHSSLRAWLPLLVMVLSLAFQTGCKNRKTVINQAPAPAPVAPTASTPGSTTATDTADFDDPCDPDDPDCDLDSIDPSEIPTDDFDPTDMLAGGPNITINVVNNGVIHVGDRRRRRHPRGPWWRRGEEGDLELMGGDGGHGDEGMPATAAPRRTRRTQTLAARRTPRSRSRPSPRPTWSTSRPT